MPRKRVITPDRRVERVKRLLECKSDTDLAKRLETHQTQITRWRRGEFSKSMAKLVDLLLLIISRLKREINKLKKEINNGGYKMADEKNVLISVELTEHEAWTYAQFLKRVGFNDYLSNAVDNDEAYTMVDAGEKIRDALAENGFAPR